MLLRTPQIETISGIARHRPCEGVPPRIADVMPLNLEEIRRFAPDEKSMASARALLSLRFWLELGLSPDAAWGKCRGSTVYDVGIDLSDLAYRCNCPSRKRPCRHVLGLLLLLAETPDAFPIGEPPERLQTWLLKRRSRSQPAKTPISEPNAAQAKSQQRRARQREQRVAEGIEQLQLWLADLIEEGLAALESRGSHIWEEQARRLVDAQAKGLASRLLRIGELTAASPNWPQRMLDELGRLQLLLQAWQRIDDLPNALQQEVRQCIGWTLTQQELEQCGSPVSDQWLVIGQIESEDDRLRMQRTWLLGRETKQTAMILQFARGTEPFAEQRRVGSEEVATLLFYPGAGNLRVRVLSPEELASESLRPPGLKTCEALLEQNAEQLAQSPWNDLLASVLHDVRFGRVGQNWYLCDGQGQGLSVGNPFPWELLAVSGGHAVHLAVEWNGSHCLPLAAWDVNKEGALIWTR